MLEGIGWGEAKQELFQVMNAYLEKPRQKYQELMDNPGQVDEILQEGATKARALAATLLERVKERIGR